MDDLAARLEEAMSRHPAPALSLEEAGHLVAREATGHAPDPEEIARTIRDRPGPLRVLEGDGRRVGVVGPRRWIVAPRRRFPSPRSLAARMRETVRALGEGLEPGSNLALARWARIMHEERRVRTLLLRPRGRSSGSGSPPVVERG